jgi:hypothetical protein
MYGLEAVLQTRCVTALPVHLETFFGEYCGIIAKISKPKQAVETAIAYFRPIWKPNARRKIRIACLN